MLHPGLVVDDHIAVILADRIDHLAQVVVDGAVAARAFGAAHGDQVKAVTLGQRRLDLIAQVVVFAHPAGHGAHRRAALSE